MQPAILFVGHGSRDPEGTREFLRLVERFREREPERIVEAGFLEFARPMLGEGIDRCVERGARAIAVLPGMLMAAGHAKNDIPSEIHEARRRHGNVQFYYGRHLHLHPKIIALCAIRIEEALRACEKMGTGSGHTPKNAEDSNRRPVPVPIFSHALATAERAERQDTLLLVVGRGSSDPDANADVQKLARILWEGMGFGWAAACYIGVTTPELPEALDRCRRMGFGRIIVFPFFLFTGILEKRIRRLAEEFARQHPQTTFLCADYLNFHPLLYDVFLERAREAIDGSPNMNCELCKYRVKLPGFEEAVGQPQFGHHHHVRGIGQNEGNHH